MPWLLLLLYPTAWAGLYAISSEFWFLPSGLRVAMLWITPTRRWAWLAIAEWVGITAVSVAGGVHLTLVAAIAGIFLPWLVYAAATREVRRHEALVQHDGIAYRAPLTLVAGLIGAGFNSLLLTGLHWLDGQPMPNAVGTLLTFALGDYAGAIVLAPLIVLAIEEWRSPSLARRYLHRGAVAVPFLGLAISLWPSLGFPEQYRWLLVSAPLIAVGAIHGRTAAVLGMTMLAFGFLLVTRSPDPMWLPEEIQRVLTVAGSAALLLGARRDATHLQRKRLSASIEELQLKTDALREAAIRLSSQREAESRKLGLELHDEVGQDMTALATRIHLAERSANSDAMREELRLLQCMVSTAHDHLRSVIRHLHPIALERFGLERALTHGPLSEIASDAGIDYHCAIVGPAATLPLDVATAMYRICQEAVTNGVRHGCGGKIAVHLSIRAKARGREVELSIHDLAGAIELSPGTTGLGLQGIRDRAHSLGASYRFSAENGQPRHWLNLILPGNHGGTRLREGGTHGPHDMPSQYRDASSFLVQVGHVGPGSPQP